MACVRLYECPPNGQGITALIALNILTALNVQWKDIPFNSATRLHLLIEVMRIAFADAHRYGAARHTSSYAERIIMFATHSYVADQDMVSVPASALLTM